MWVDTIKNTVPDLSSHFDCFYLLHKTCFARANSFKVTLLTISADIQNRLGKKRKKKKWMTPKPICGWTNNWQKKKITFFFRNIAFILTVFIISPLACFLVLFLLLLHLLALWYFRHKVLRVLVALPHTQMAPPAGTVHLAHRQGSLLPHIITLQWSNQLCSSVLFFLFLSFFKLLYHTMANKTVLLF